MGNSYLLTAVIALAVVTLAVTTYRSIAAQKHSRAFALIGVGLLTIYMIIQVLAWKDLSEVLRADTLHPVWGLANMPNAFYDAWAYVGLAFMLTGGIIHLRSRKSKQSPAK